MRDHVSHDPEARRLTEEDLALIFEYLDTDRTGTLSIEEFAHALAFLPKPVLPAWYSPKQAEANAGTLCPDDPVAHDPAAEGMARAVSRDEPALPELPGSSAARA